MTYRLLLSTLEQLRALGLRLDSLVDEELVKRQQLVQDEAGLHAVRRRQEVLSEVEEKLIGARAVCDSVLECCQRVKAGSLTVTSLPAAIAPEVLDVTRRWRKAREELQPIREELDDLLGLQLDRDLECAEQTQLDQLHVSVQAKDAEAANLQRHLKELLTGRLEAARSEVRGLEEEKRRIITEAQDKVRARYGQALRSCDEARIPLASLEPHRAQKVQDVGRLHGQLAAQLEEEEDAQARKTRLESETAAVKAPAGGSALAADQHAANEAKLQKLQGEAAGIRVAAEQARADRNFVGWRKLLEQERALRHQLDEHNASSLYGARPTASACSAGVDWAEAVSEADKQVGASRAKWQATALKAADEWKEWQRSREEIKAVTMELHAWLRVSLEEQIFIECLNFDAIKVPASIDFRTRHIAVTKRALTELENQQAEIHPKVAAAELQLKNLGWPSEEDSL